MTVCHCDPDWPAYAECEICQDRRCMASCGHLVIDHDVHGLCEICWDCTGLQPTAPAKRRKKGGQS